MKLLKIIIAGFLLLLLNSCNNQELTAPDISGKFVVDKAEYIVNKDIDPQNNISWFVEYKVTYHFENLPGFLSLVGFSTNADSIGLFYNIDGIPPSVIEKNINFGDRLWISKNLAAGDTITINLDLSGAFYRKAVNEIRYVNGFHWSDSHKIVVK